MSETAHTPGNWSWWTSCSWRRLRSDLGHGNTTDVLMPTVHRDGQADIIVSDDDMAVIVAAPDMLAALRPLAELPVGAELFIDDEGLDTVLYKNGGKSITARDIMNARAAIAKAEGRS